MHEIHLNPLIVITYMHLHCDRRERTRPSRGRSLVVRISRCGAHAGCTVMTWVRFPATADFDPHIVKKGPSQAFAVDEHRHEYFFLGILAAPTLQTRFFSELCLLHDHELMLHELMHATDITQRDIPTSAHRDPEGTRRHVLVAGASALPECHFDCTAHCAFSHQRVN
jgi:hypothetical protein